MYFLRENPELFFYEKFMQVVPGFGKKKDDARKIVRNYHKLADSDTGMMAVKIEIPNTLRKFEIDLDDFFLDIKHKKRFEEVLRSPKGARMIRSRQYISAIYFLTADEVLWKLSENQVGQYGIFFWNMKLKGIDLNGYIFLMAAKSVHSGVPLIDEDEIADAEIVTPEILKVIVNGWYLRAEGISLIEDIVEVY